MIPTPEEVAALVKGLLDREELHANRDGLLAYRRVPMCEQASAALTALHARAEAAEARVRELELSAYLVVNTPFDTQDGHDAMVTLMAALTPDTPAR